MTTTEQGPQSAAFDAPAVEGSLVSPREPSRSLAGRIGSFVERVGKVFGLSEKPARYEGSSMHLPDGINEWGNGRRVFLSQESRASEAFKLYVLRTDEEEARFNASMSADYPQMRRNLKALIAEDKRREREQLETE